MEFRDRYCWMRNFLNINNIKNHFSNSIRLNVLFMTRKIQFPYALWWTCSKPNHLCLICFHFPLVLMLGNATRKFCITFCISYYLSPLKYYKLWMRRFNTWKMLLLNIITSWYITLWPMGWCEEEILRCRAQWLTFIVWFYI